MEVVNEIKYTSRENLSHIYWKLLHTITFFNCFFDCEIVKKRHLEIIEKLEHFSKLLSCKICSEHFLQSLENAKKIDLEKKYSLFYWSVDFHNEVNKKLGKNTLSHEEAFNIWNKKE
jgi:hypothetical protein